MITPNTKLDKNNTGVFMFRKYGDKLHQTKAFLEKGKELQQKYDREISAIEQDGKSSIAKISNLVRAEMKESFELYKKEMAEIHAAQRKQLRTEAMWQWIILIAIALAALVKEIYL